VQATRKSAFLRRSFCLTFEFSGNRCASGADIASELGAHIAQDAQDFLIGDRIFGVPRVFTWNCRRASSI